MLDTARRGGEMHDANHELPHAASDVSVSAGTIYVVATPIGNLDDLSPRARSVLAAADLLICEDTRRTAALCARFEIRTRRVSLHAHNEARRIPELLERLAGGESLALVSDAGTPLLSDPGGDLVRAAIEAGHRIVPIPGASAILAALVASGLPSRPFTFVGFLPRKGVARRRWLERIASLPGSVILFESPARTAQTLGELFLALGPRRVAIARELTKRFEELVRGELGSLTLPPLRGEVTIVVEGVSLDELDALTRGTTPLPEDEIDGWLASRLEAGVSARDVARELAARTGLSRSAAYRRVLAR
jgi:16S rRNA (cytidine1402-2'-O)-methyltransferase